MIHVNEIAVNWKKGMTVQDALDAMNYDFAHIMVTINGEVISEKEFDSHQIPDGADVRAIHIFHGG
jgi:thiamine biosynthesis protein ThiS